MAMVRPIRSMEYPVIPIIKELPATNTNAFLSTLYKIWLVSYFFYLVYILILSGKTDKGIFRLTFSCCKPVKGTDFPSTVSPHPREAKGVRFKGLTNDSRMIASCRQLRLITLGHSTSISSQLFHQRFNRLLNKDRAIIHNNTIINQPLHILNNMGSQENSLVLGTGIIT